MKGTVIYDLSSMPDGISSEKLIEILERTGFLIYDSQKGQKPTFIKTGRKSIKIEIKDIRKCPSLE